MKKTKGSFRRRKNPPDNSAVLQADKDIQAEIRKKWRSMRKPTEADAERLRLAERKRELKAERLRKQFGPS